MSAVLLSRIKMVKEERTGVHAKSTGQSMSRMLKITQQGIQHAWSRLRKEERL